MLAVTKVQQLCCRSSLRLWHRPCSSTSSSTPTPSLATVRVEGAEFPRDAWTNVTPRILGSVGRRLHLQPQHPLGLIKRRIVDYFNQVRHSSS